MNRAFFARGSRIVPRLWMGLRPMEGYALADAGFSDLVLCAKELRLPAARFPGMRVHHVALDDSGLPMTWAEGRDALRMGQIVARRLAQGGRVLVTCAEGRNRSGLVCALALVALGFDPEQAIAMVRTQRNPDLPANRPALVNPYFVGFLRSIKSGRDAFS